MLHNSCFESAAVCSHFLWVFEFVTVGRSLFLAVWLPLLTSGSEQCLSLLFGDRNCIDLHVFNSSKNVTKSFRICQRQLLSLEMYKGLSQKDSEAYCIFLAILMARASCDLVKSGGVVFLKFRWGRRFRCTFPMWGWLWMCWRRTSNRQQSVWRLPRTLGKLHRRCPWASVIRGWSIVMGQRNVGVSADSQRYVVEGWAYTGERDWNLTQKPGQNSYVGLGDKVKAG